MPEASMRDRGASFSGPAALVTGASAGIGAELARLLAARGATLVLTARRADRLDALADELRRAHGVRIETLAADLEDADAPQALADGISARGLEVGTLVNNAGFGLRGAFADQPLDRLLAMLQVNIVALTRLTGLLLPGMLARRAGGIINIASTAAFQPGPYMAVYYASKAYVLHFSEALSHETRRSGVVVTAVCPGSTATEFADIAGLAGSRLMRHAAMSAANVARIGLAGHLAGKSLIVTGAANALTPLASRLLPRRLMANLVARVQRP